MPKVNFKLSGMRFLALPETLLSETQYLLIKINPIVLNCGIDSFPRFDNTTVHNMLMLCENIQKFFIKAFD